MFEAVGMPVSRLIRTRYGSINLPSNLTRGKFERLSKEVVEAWIKESGLDKEPVSKLIPSRPKAGPAGGTPERDQVLEQLQGHQEEDLPPETDLLQKLREAEESLHPARRRAGR